MQGVLPLERHAGSLGVRVRIRVRVRVRVRVTWCNLVGQSHTEPMDDTTAKGMQVREGEERWGSEREPTPYAVASTR